MSRAIKALVVDDHPLIAEATCSVLEQIDGVQVVGIAGNGEACMEMVEKHRPELIFMDYHLPGEFGSHVAAQVKREYPDTHIVVFTGIDIPSIYNRLLEIGVSGIISKEWGHETIKNMVNCILDNHTMLPISLFRQTRIDNAHFTGDVKLTQDEVKILSMLVKGATIEQIADAIHVSRRSVDNYLKKINEKFGVTTRVQAIEKFIRIQEEQYGQTRTERE